MSANRRHTGRRKRGSLGDVTLNPFPKGKYVDRTRAKTYKSRDLTKTYVPRT